LLLCAALLALPPASGAAAEHVVEVAASGGLRHVRYLEWGAFGKLLDSEEGWIPAAGARVRIRVGRVVGELSGALARGDLRYAGLVQSGAGQVRSTSAARFLDGAGRAGVVVDPWRRLTLLAGASTHRWDRDIHSTTLASGGVVTPVAGLSEVYAWWQLEAAAQLALVAAPRLAWLADVHALQTRAPHVTVDWRGAKVRLPLGTRAAWGAGTELQVTLRPGLFVFAAAGVDRLRLGESPPVAAGRSWLTEPESETWSVRLDAGIGARL
jgi:hypothetical protein